MANPIQRRTNSSSNRIRCSSITKRLVTLISLLLFLTSLATLPLLVTSKQHQSQSSKSLYQTLGVPVDCTTDQIRKAYRKSALKHHPDKGGNEETFKEISRAYEVLCDTDQRAAYDRFGQAGIDNNGASANSSAGASGQHTPGGAEFFSSQFFGNNGNNKNHGSQSFRSNSSPFTFGGGGGAPGMNVDLQELLRNMMNGNGGGGGGGNSSPYSSSKQQHQQQSKPTIYTRPVECSLEDLFNGSTKKLKVQLGNKSGRHKVFKVQIKPGWKAGTKIKYNATNKFPGITFVVQEKKHAHFERRGDDLVYRHQLEPLESRAKAYPQQSVPLLLTIPLLDGTIWERTIPVTYLRAGQSIHVPNEGMPVQQQGSSGTENGGGARGNLIIEFYDFYNGRNESAD